MRFNPIGGEPRGRGDEGASFLPEDYVQQKAEQRVNLISVTLFCVVMFGVVAAFFVTNREWATVKQQQAEINREYAREAEKIEQLKELESQKAEMLQQAEITTALLERVPRSVLLAELINRMPARMTLTELNLTSRRIREQPPPQPAASNQPRSLSSAGRGRRQSAQKNEPPPTPAPPRYEFSLQIIGLASTDSDVADYHAALMRCPLLERVELIFSGATVVDSVPMRRFRIETTIRSDADARHIEPLLVPRYGRHPGFAGGTPYSVRERRPAPEEGFTQPGRDDGEAVVHGQENPPPQE